MKQLPAYINGTLPFRPQAKRPIQKLRRIPLRTWTCACKQYNLSSTQACSACGEARGTP